MENRDSSMGRQVAVGSLQAQLKALMGWEVSEVLDGVSFSLCRGLL